MISRAEGYRRSVGKERLGLEVAQNFLHTVLSECSALVDDRVLNYTHGDLVVASGKYIEVKTQPIDPTRYRQNFVELFEKTQKQEHADGFDRVARLLGMAPDCLASTRVTSRETPNLPLGMLPYVSVSIESFSTAACVMYVNPYFQTKYVYCYEKPFLRSQIAHALATKGLGRGLGNSNRDTFSVFIDYPDAVWSFDHDTGWRYAGAASEQHVKAALQTCLT